jgi:hypothetical protein
MSVRSLTLRLIAERSENLRKSSHPAAVSQMSPKVDTPALLPAAFYRGSQPEPEEEAEDVTETTEAQGLRPRFETPLESIPGGIKSRFGLKSQRMSEISRSIDAYTSQVTVAISESEDDEDERRAHSTPFTIELQSH